MLAALSSAKNKLSQNYMIYLIIVIYTIVFSFVSIVKHRSFSSTAWDLGIYEQILWSTVNSGRLFWYSTELPINSGGCFFGIHFSPIFFLILPIYWIFQTTETLLILQSFFLALGALPIYWIAQRRVHRRTALLFAMVFVLYPPLLAMNLNDFHVQTLLPAFFLFAFHYFREEEWGKYLFFVILALMTIEFVPFLVIFLGLYGLWVNRNTFLKAPDSDGVRKLFGDKRILCSIITVALGIFWFVLSRRMLFYFNPNPRPHPNWKEFGDPVYDPIGLLLGFISDPLRTLQALISPPTEKLKYIVQLFAPVALLSFLDLPSLMIGAPWFAAAFLSNYPSYYQAEGAQYVAFVAPFIFVSALNGTKRFIAIIQEVGGRIRVKPLPSITPKRVFTMMILISVISLATLGTRIEMVHITLRNRTLEKMIELIPADASVLTQNDIFPHVCRRIEAYVGGLKWEDENWRVYYSSIDVDYIIVDTNSVSWYGKNLSDYLSLRVRNGEFGVITAVDGMWLLKKNHTEKPAFEFENWVLENGMLGKFYNEELPSSNGSPAFISAFLDTEWEWSSTSLFPTINNDSFNLVLSADLNIASEGEYEFKTVGNASMLRIDGRLLFQQFGGDIVTISLDEDVYRIEIEYTDLKAHGHLGLFWKTPKASSFEVIPNANLRLPMDDENIKG